MSKICKEYISCFTHCDHHAGIEKAKRAAQRDNRETEAIGNERTEVIINLKHILNNKNEADAPNITDAKETLNGIEPIGIRVNIFADITYMGYPGG